MKDIWSSFFGTFFLGCFGVILLVLFTGWLVMILWNWLMPNIFPGISEINIWQAYGLTILSKLLFETKVNITKKD